MANLALTEITSSLAATRFMDMSRDGNWIAATPLSTGTATVFPVYKKTAGGDFTGASISITTPAITTINSVAFSPDSQKLAIAAANNNVYIYNLIGDVWTYDKAIPIGFTPNTIKFAKDNVDLFVCATTAMHLVFNTNTSAELYRIGQPAGFYIDTTYTTVENTFIVAPTATNTTSSTVNVFTKSGSTYIRSAVTNTSFNVYGVNISKDGLKISVSGNNGTLIYRRAYTDQTFLPTVIYGTAPVTGGGVFYKDRYIVGTRNAFFAFDSLRANKYLEASTYNLLTVTGGETNTALQLMSSLATDTFAAYTPNSTIPRVYKISEISYSDAVFNNNQTFTGYTPPSVQVAVSKDKSRFWNMHSTKTNNSQIYSIGKIIDGRFVTDNLLSFSNTPTSVSPRAGGISDFSDDNTYFAQVGTDLLRLFRLNTDGIYDELSFTTALTISPIGAKISPTNQYVVSYNPTVINIHKINGAAPVTLIPVNLNGTTLADMVSVVWYSDTELMVGSRTAGMYFFRYNAGLNRFDLVRTASDATFAVNAMVMTEDKRFMYAVRTTVSGTFWGSKFTITDFDNITFSGTFTDSFGTGTTTTKFIKISPDGTKLLVTGPSAPYVGLYNINTTTGDLSARIVPTSTVTATQLCYGAEWLDNAVFVLSYNGEYDAGLSIRAFRYNPTPNTITNEASAYMTSTTFPTIVKAALSNDTNHIYVSGSAAPTVGLTRFTKNANGRYNQIGLLDTFSNNGVETFANGTLMLGVSTSAGANNGRLYTLNGQGIFENFTTVSLPGAINPTYFNKIDENNIVFVSSTSNGGYVHLHIDNNGTITRKADIPRFNTNAYLYVGSSFGGQYIYFSESTTNLRIYERQLNGDYTLKTTQVVFNPNINRLYPSPANPSIGFVKVLTSIYYTDINTDGSLTINTSTVIQPNAAALVWYSDGSGFFITGTTPVSGAFNRSYSFDNTTKRYFPNPTIDYPMSLSTSLTYVASGTDVSNPAKDSTVYVQSVNANVSGTNYGVRGLGLYTVETPKVITSNIITNLNPIQSTGELETDFALYGDVLLNPITTTGVADTTIVANIDFTLNSFTVSGFFGEKDEYDIDLILTTAISLVRPEGFDTITTTPLEQPYAYGEVFINPITTNMLAALLPDISGDVLINSFTTTGILGEEGSISGDTVISSITTSGEIISTPFIDAETIIPQITTMGVLSGGESGSIEVVLNNITTIGELEQQQNATIDVTLNSISTDGVIETDLAIISDTFINSITTEITSYIIGNTITGDTIINSIVIDGTVLLELDANIDVTLNSISTEAELRVSGNILPSDVIISSIQTEGILSQTQEIDGVIILNTITSNGLLEIRPGISGNTIIPSVITTAELNVIPSRRRRFLNIV